MGPAACGEPVRPAGLKSCFRQNRFVGAIEIKGPSKDRSHINRGIENDLHKLLGIGNTIDIGVAIGFYLVSPTNLENKKVIKRNGRSLGVNILMKKTQPNPSKGR